MSGLHAAFYDPIMRATEEACLRDWRAELLAAARGEVLEVGAGTGANLGGYGREVSRLIVAEPDGAMRARLERKLRASPPSPPVEVTGASLVALPFSDASFDAVVATLVLCTVPDAARALSELHRVLRPGGSFFFLEHVAARDPGRYRWQRRLEPVWRVFAGGCRLTRDTEAAIADAGFALERVTRESLRKAPPWVRPSIRGIARKASA